MRGYKVYVQPDLPREFFISSEDNGKELISEIQSAHNVTVQPGNLFPALIKDNENIAMGKSLFKGWKINDDDRMLVDVGLLAGVREVVAIFTSHELNTMFFKETGDNQFQILSNVGKFEDLGAFNEFESQGAVFGFLRKKLTDNRIYSKMSPNDRVLYICDLISSDFSVVIVPKTLL